MTKEQIWAIIFNVYHEAKEYVALFNKKGVTLVEVLISVAIIAVSLLSIFVFTTKVKNRTATENNMLDAFYNNVSAYEIIQKELNRTGNIDEAVKVAIEATKGTSGKYVKHLIVEVVPVVIYPNDVNIAEAEPESLPEDINNDGIIDFYKAVDDNGETRILYYNSGVVSPDFNLSYDIPIYKIKINTRLGIHQWDNLTVETLVCKNGGIGVYYEQ